MTILEIILKYNLTTAEKASALANDIMAVFGIAYKASYPTTPTFPDTALKVMLIANGWAADETEAGVISGKFADFDFAIEVVSNQGTIAIIIVIEIIE